MMSPIACLILLLVAAGAVSAAVLHEHHGGALSLKERADKANRRLSDLEGAPARKTTQFKFDIQQLQEEVAEIDRDWHLCQKVADQHDEQSRVAHSHREKHKLNTHLSESGDRVNHHSKFKRLAAFHAEKLHFAEQEFSRVGVARALCDEGLLTLDDVRGRLSVLAEEVDAHGEL